jgi:hypothetical protein
MEELSIYLVGILERLENVVGFLKLCQNMTRGFDTLSLG